MPIYTYECRNCGAREQVVAKMDDAQPERLEACEEDCTEPRPERVPTRTGFALKGSGWFKDGY